MYKTIIQKTVTIPEVKLLPDPGFLEEKFNSFVEELGMSTGEAILAIAEDITIDQFLSKNFPQYNATYIDSGKGNGKIKVELELDPYFYEE